MMIQCRYSLIILSTELIRVLVNHDLYVIFDLKKFTSRVCSSGLLMRTVMILAQSSMDAISAVALFRVYCVLGNVMQAIKISNENFFKNYDENVDKSNNVC